MLGPAILMDGQLIHVHENGNMDEWKLAEQKNVTASMDQSRILPPARWCTHAAPIQRTRSLYDTEHQIQEL